MAMSKAHHYLAYKPTGYKKKKRIVSWLGVAFPGNGWVWKGPNMLNNSAQYVKPEWERRKYISF